MSFFLLHRALNLHFSNSYTHQTLHLFPCLYPEGFYWGIYIICLIIYNILFPPKLWQKWDTPNSLFF